MYIINTAKIDLYFRMDSNGLCLSLGRTREGGRYDHEPIHIYIFRSTGSLQNLFRIPLILFGAPQLRSKPLNLKSGKKVAF